MYLPEGFDQKAARELRAGGWRTIEQITKDEDAGALGCTHVLKNGQPVQL